jgi:RNA polymerase sigma-70 factor (ECF subfamily)
MTTPIAQRVRRLLARESGLDQDAFTHLYKRHLEPVFNYVRYRLGPEEAEDVTADIFLRAWTKRQSYDPGRGAPSTWLWAIARNAVIDRLRQRRPVYVELPGDLAADDDPLAEIEGEEEWHRVQVALSRLLPVDQEIITLRFGAGYTNRKIAALLDLSEANVAQRLRRALRKMRAYFQGVDVP